MVVEPDELERVGLGGGSLSVRSGDPGPRQGGGREEGGLESSERPQEEAPLHLTP